MHQHRHDPAHALHRAAVHLSALHTGTAGAILSRGRGARKAVWQLGRGAWHKLQPPPLRNRGYPSHRRRLPHQRSEDLLHHGWGCLLLHGLVYCRGLRGYIAQHDVSRGACRHRRHDRGRRLEHAGYEGYRQPGCSVRRLPDYRRHGARQARRAPWRGCGGVLQLGLLVHISWRGMGGPATCYQLLHRGPIPARPRAHLPRPSHTTRRGQYCHPL